jgi:photoactive yellow protein
MRRLNGTTPGFDEPDLAVQIGQMPAEQIDALPFGVILLDNQQTVTFFSAAEARLSGYRKPAVGRHFFAEIAPCMNTPAFRGRIAMALQTGELDIEFYHIGDFNDPQRDIRVRAQSAPEGGCWLFLQRGS